MDVDNARDSLRRKSIVKGIILAIIANFIVCTLSTVVFAVDMLANNREAFSDYLAVVALIVVGPGAFLVAVLPATLAGALDALLLCRLSRRDELRGSKGLFMGPLLGLFFGLVIGGILVFQASSYASDIRDYSASIAVGAVVTGVSILVGLWHSWRMKHYLQRQSELSNLERSAKRQ
jgi:MFS family permease